MSTDDNMIELAALLLEHKYPDRMVDQVFMIPEARVTVHHVLVPRTRGPQPISDRAKRLKEQFAAAKMTRRGAGT